MSTVKIHTGNLIVLGTLYAISDLVQVRLSAQLKKGHLLLGGEKRTSNVLNHSAIAASGKGRASLTLGAQAGQSASSPPQI